MSKIRSSGEIAAIVTAVLVPLARILLRCGVNYDEFSKLAKRAFVQAASEGYGVRNRPTSIARVAVMTGMSRREVSRVRQELSNGSVGRPSTRNLPAEVLERWHTDPDYLDEEGTPRALSHNGPRGSFSALVRTVSSDIPPKALEKELIRAGALKLGPGRKIMPVTRQFVPQDSLEKLVDGLQFGLRRLVEVVDHNTEPKNRSESWFQRVVHTGHVPDSSVPEIRESLSGVLTGFAERIDNHLNAVRGRIRKGRATGLTTVGIGLYYFEGPTD